MPVGAKQGPSGWRVRVGLTDGRDSCHNHQMDRSHRKVVIVVVALAVWAVVTPHMWRDLRGRTPDQVRGPKWLWWIASSNLTGSLAYWMFARKSAD